MKQSGQKDVHVAVPETGSHNETLAVDHGCPAWDFDLCNRSDRSNVAVVDKDCAAFEGRFRRGEINLCTNQGKVGRVALGSCKKCWNQEKSQGQSKSHVYNIRRRRRLCSEVGPLLEAALILLTLCGD